MRRYAAKKGLSMTTTVLTGTTKGVFLLDSPDRREWDITGPLCDGWPINHVIGDPATGQIWAAGGSDWHGAGIWRSTDHGQTWTLARLTKGQMDHWMESDTAFAEMIGWKPGPAPQYDGEINAIWSLGRVGNRLYAGTKPAQLFTSDDDGATWTVVDSLANHPSRPDWHPGAAGLVLHSIVGDPANPDKLWLGISAAGVFATEDGGQTWDRRNRRSNAETAHAHDHAPGHDHGPDVGLCVHNFGRAPANGDLLYQQNHHGVFRSNDGGRSWDDISDGLPSTFGFPIALHPHDPQTVWTLPLNGDTQGRFPPGASAAVWRTRDGGTTWQGLNDGLPTKNCFFTVLRQAMATDRAAPAGVYFGTNSGSIFATRDEGDHWDEIARHLPTVLSVEVLERA
jgi:photosystem II stability/assembly factor-like uncharacterized protein